MKFLLFSDLHHYPNVFDGGTWEDLGVLQKAAEENECEFMIHAGDFCHGPSLVPDYVKAYNEFHIPSYHCLGNHDSDKTPIEETLKAYNMPDDHYYFDHGGYRMIITNPNFYKDGEEYVRYSMGNYYPHADTRETMPPEQIAWLKETVESSPYPCIIFSHPSFERCDGVKNRDLVLQVIDEANRKKPHSVLMCINGHHHRDFVRIRNGVIYWDMNSVSYDWVPNQHDCYPKELCDEIRLLNHTLVYEDPLYAIVTVEGTTVTAEGTESSMMLGVTREQSGNVPYDKAGRPVTPTVQSFNITLG